MERDENAAGVVKVTEAETPSRAGVRRRKPRDKTPEPTSRARRAELKLEQSKDLGQSGKEATPPPTATAPTEPHLLDDPTPGNIQEEGFIDAFYQPRTLTGLIVLVVYVVYVTFYHERDILAQSNRTKSGILLAASAFLMYCAVQLRDGHLLRPHPVVWRIVHGTGLLYFLVLVYLLSQDLRGIHGFLQLFDERVGEPQTERSYGSDCRLYKANSTDPYGNIKDQVYDRFMVAHFLGWTLKALILRDWGLMWVASVLFEVLEVSFQHMYPNFNECWWDHLFLDIFGCNLMGMIFGMRLVTYMGTHQFNWTGQAPVRTLTRFGKVKRVALQFTPYSFETYRWQLFKSWRRFAIGVAVLFILLLGEMNAFFLKSTFSIPVDSDINLYRLSFWVFMTYMAIFEFHHFAEGRGRRIGVNSWLAGSLVTFETLLVAKHTYQERMFSLEQLVPARFIVVGYQATAVLIAATALTKSARWLLVRASGAKEIADAEKLKADRRARSERANSFGSLERAVPGAGALMRASAVLEHLSQFLVFAIPVPLLIVLAMDCYRSTTHPPPQPGEQGW